MPDIVEMDVVPVTCECAGHFHEAPCQPAARSIPTALSPAGAAAGRRLRFSHPVQRMRWAVSTHSILSPFSSQLLPGRFPQRP